jgi:prevent-host-death family protein
MTIISAVDARANFADLINRSAYGKERIAVARRGKALVALVPIEDLEIIEAVEDQLDLEEARKALDEPGGNISLEAVRKSLGL